MTDKLDVAETIVELMDGMCFQSLGTILAGVDSDEFGTVVLQTWPNGDNLPSVDFLIRVTRYRPR